MNPWRSLAGLPRDVWVLFTVTLVNRSGTMVMPFLALYVSRELALGNGLAGWMLTTIGLCGLVVAPLSGRLVDRFGAVRVLNASLFGAGAVLLGFPFARSVPALFAAVAAWAVMNEMMRPASLAVAADAAPPELRKQSFAVSRLAVNLGMSIGPVIGGFLAERSYALLFIVNAATSLAAGMLLLALPLELRWAAKRDASAAPGETAPALPWWSGDARLVAMLVASVPVGIVFFQVLGAMPLYLERDLKLTESTIGLVFAVNTVLIVLFEVPLNDAMAGWSHRASLVTGAAFTALGFGALAFAIGPWSAALTVAVWTIGEMILFPSQAAYVSELAPPEHRGRYMGLYTMTFAVAFSAAPWLGTRLLDSIGGPALWVCTFAFGLLSAALYARVART